MVPVDVKEWFIEARILQPNGLSAVAPFCQETLECRFHRVPFVTCFFTNAGDLSLEFPVFIEKATGLDLVKKWRDFGDDDAKEDSDVTLIAEDQKFHVLKKYLSTHSAYFKSLFFGNFSESGKSEIELKDIDADDFQQFLELIYGETDVEDSSVLQILHLADFFYSKTAIRKCVHFLCEKSNLPLKEKLYAAIKYKLDILKGKCISELKTHDDVLSIIPEDPSQFDIALWRELLVKSSSLGK